MLLARQTHENFEVMIADDGSTDEQSAESVLDELRPPIAYQVWRLRESGAPPRSPNIAWNYARLLALGDFIITMHPEIMVPPDAIESMLDEHERPYRSVPCQYTIGTEYQQNRIDRLDWIADLRELQRLPDFWITPGPWLYDNLSAPDYRSHLSFAGGYSDDWAFISSQAGVPFFPDVEDPDFLSDDAWLHKQELAADRPSRGVGIEVYHQWHERIYRDDRPHYSPRIRRTMDADRDAAADWKPSS
jgi:glycosyltransferase involved in cell wall biosynthesis